KGEGRIIRLLQLQHQLGQRVEVDASLLQHLNGNVSHDGSMPSGTSRMLAAFTVQRSWSLPRSFSITARKASSKSIPREFAKAQRMKRISPISKAKSLSASPGFLGFSPKRWFTSRASSPTSSVRRASMERGFQYPS